MAAAAAAAALLAHSLAAVDTARAWVGGDGDCGPRTFEMKSSAGGGWGWQEFEQGLLGDEDSKRRKALGGLAEGAKAGQGKAGITSHDMSWLQTNLMRPELQDPYGVFGMRR